MAVAQYDGVKVFSATKYRDREVLGDFLTSWVSTQPDLEIVDHVVRQSSDVAYHCLSILIFYRTRRA